MATVSGSIRTFLKKAKSPFLHFFTDKVIRTSLRTIKTDLPKGLQIPYGTFAFDIYQIGATQCVVTFEDGNYITIIESNQKNAAGVFKFPGQPYIERSDSIKKIQFNGPIKDAEIVIIFHRLIHRQT